MNSALPNQKKLVPISDAAEILGVSIDTIRRWDKSGILHSERPDGKNRYFSLSELESHKSQKPLSISEVAKKLNMSATTLRRLEARGILQPERNKAGERVYHKDSLNEFLNSDYFHRKKQVKEPVKDPTLTKSIQNHEKIIPKLDDINLSETPATESFNEASRPASRNAASSHTSLREEIGSIHPRPKNVPWLSASYDKADLIPNLKLHQRIPEFLASVVIFVLLIAIGVTNITLSAAQTSQSKQAPAVLSETVTNTAPAEASISGELTAKSIEVSKTEPTAESTAEPVTLDSIQSLLEEAANTDSNEATEAAKEESGGGPNLDNFKIILAIRTKGVKFINIREKPSTESAELGKARIGDTFEMVSRDQGWYEIKLNDQSNGFISEEFAEIKEIN